MMSITFVLCFASIAILAGCSWNGDSAVNHPEQDPGEKAQELAADTPTATGQEM